MAATVQIHEMSATDTGVDKTSGTVRFKSAIETTVDDQNKLVIPPSGTDWSYTKQLRAYVTAAPSVYLENLEAYSDGGNGFGTGIDVQYDVQQTFQTQTDSDISGTSIFTKTDGDAIDMDAFDTQFTDGDSTPDYWGSNLRLQMSVTSTASPGQLSTEGLTFSYDET